MGGREHRGGAAAEVDGLEGREVFLFREAGFWPLLHEASFCKECLDECAEIGAAWGVLVERAVGADAVAEGNVEVEMHWRKF